jgi:hypothetical protein
MRAELAEIRLVLYADGVSRVEVSKMRLCIET